MNKAGIFNNLEVKVINDHIHIIATDEIEKRTVLTGVGGKIYYYKHYLNNEIKNPDIMNPIIYYIKTANQKYDRIISIDSFSIVRYLFSNYNDHDNNVEIIKVLDKNEIITLCVITSKNIKKVI